jgi:RHS repeat-associated protein
MPRLNAMHRDTPTLAVIEPRGVSVRSVAYHRRSSAQTPRAHITQHTLDLAGRTSHSRDPRLFALHQDDESTRPNQTTLTSLSGRALLSNNVDAGWRLSLTGAAGQALESWDEQLNHQRFVYDSLMRPLFGFEQVVGEEQRRTLCFSYADASIESARHNRCGQLIRHDDSAGTQHFSEFSVLGVSLEQSRRFLESPEIPDWPVPEAERDQLLELQEAVTRTGCNAVGELIEHIDALGSVQSLHQTVAGELYETCVTLAGDVTPTILVSQIQYNAFGQIEHQTAGNGVVTHATFDPADGHLKTLLAQVPGAAPLQNLTYTYDPVGNPVRISDDAQPIRYFRNQRIAAINTYGYDTLYRLIEARGRQRINASSGPGLPEFVSLPDANQLENYRQTFDYNAGGNLEILHHSADSGSRTECTAVAALSNRSLPWIDGSERPTDAEIEAGYDANGNLKTLQRGQSLQWDALNCLRQVDQVVRDDGPNDAECYVYDGSGQRLRKIRTAYTGTLTRTHETRYLPGVEIRTSPEETLHVISVQAGRSRVQILHWAKGQPVGIAANQQRYTLTDHLGSSTLELDTNADLISEESYYPYGGTAWWAGRDKVEASYKTIRYSGQERDATGLYYYGFRYYMPWRQRWLNTDPMGTIDGPNLYVMVGGNPIGYIDQQGLAKTSTKVSWGQYGKALGTNVARGVTGAIVSGSVKWGLKAAVGAAANSPLIRTANMIQKSASHAYAGLGIAKNIIRANQIENRIAKVALEAGGALLGVGIGAASGFFSSDPSGELIDLGRNVVRSSMGRMTSVIGPSLTFHRGVSSSAIAADYAADISSNVLVDITEGFVTSNVSATLPGLARAGINGAAKQIVGTTYRSLTKVNASYNEWNSSSLENISKDDVKDGAKGVAHDTAMGTTYGVYTDLLHRGTDALLNAAGIQWNPVAESVYKNIDWVGNIDPYVGQAVLDGHAMDEVTNVPTATMPRANWSAKGEWQRVGQAARLLPQHRQRQQTTSV